MLRERAVIMALVDDGSVPRPGERWGEVQTVREGEGASRFPRGRQRSERDSQCTACAKLVSAPGKSRVGQPAQQPCALVAYLPGYREWRAAREERARACYGATTEPVEAKYAREG